MLLPTSEERKNLINLANTLGYKTKASVPAFVKLKLTQTIDAIGDQTNKQPDKAHKHNKEQQKTQAKQSIV